MEDMIGGEIFRLIGLGCRWCIISIKAAFSGEKVPSFKDIKESKSPHPDEQMLYAIGNILLGILGICAIIATLMLLGG